MKYDPSTNEVTPVVAPERSDRIIPGDVRR
jgi:hypothetical protein